jgi:hypothetical protein
MDETGTAHARPVRGSADSHVRTPVVLESRENRPKIVRLRGQSMAFRLPIKGVVIGGRSGIRARFVLLQTEHHRYPTSLRGEVSCRSNPSFFL